MTIASSAGSAGATSARCRRSPWATLSITSIGVPPTKAGSPTAISQSIEPREKMSDRASTSLPSACSGDMAREVPTTRPSLVNVWLAGLSGACHLTRPKSSTLTWPSSVIMTFSALTSRWMMPWWWAAARASATIAPMRATSAGARAPVSRSSATGRPLDHFHGQPVLVALVLETVHLGDGRVGESGGSEGLATQSFPACGGDLVGEQALEGHSSLELVVDGLVDFPHAPAAQEPDQPIPADVPLFHRPPIVPGLSPAHPGSRLQAQGSRSSTHPGLGPQERVKKSRGSDWPRGGPLGANLDVDVDVDVDVDLNPVLCLGTCRRERAIPRGASVTFFRRM